MKAAEEQFRKDNPEYRGNIPADALTASGSGLDPEISIANAQAQCARIAKARGVSQEQVNQIIVAHQQGRDLGFLGEPRINVNEVNLDLDAHFAR
jgi:K+-transporting ATPase ATPase C chain